MQDDQLSQGDVTTSPDETETSDKVETFTKEQVAEMARKARSDALAEAGRYKAESERALKAAKAAEERIAKMLKEQEEAEIAAAKDEPDKLTLLRTRSQLRARDADLIQARTELEEAKAALAQHASVTQEAAKQTVAQEMAAKYGVDGATLARLAKRTDGTADAIEDIAKSLPKAQAGQQQALRTDSNRSAGGSPQTVLNTKKDYISGKISTPQYIVKMKELGEVP